MSRAAGPITGRTVLVTGGSGGIGRTTAVGLARMGADLAIIGRDGGRTEDAAREIGAAGGGRVDMRPGEHILRSRGPRHPPAGIYALPAAIHEVSDPRRRHISPLGVRT